MGSLPNNRITHMILDMDGTLLNTEMLTDAAYKEVVESFGKIYDPKSSFEQLGKRELESAASLVEEYSLPCTVDFFHMMVAGKVKAAWSNCEAMPGANRLLQHVMKHEIPTALATNSVRSDVKRKLESPCCKGWQSCFRTTVAGDEVSKGKPDPEIYLKAASTMGVHPRNCLVIEDSLTGIAAAKAAGMEVIAIPSTPNTIGYKEIADHMLESLNKFRPELWGLAAFED